MTSFDLPVPCDGSYDDRQLTLVVQIGHRGQRQGEPGVVLVGADAPLAEHDVGIAPIEDVLGGKQELLQGLALYPALRRAGLPESPTAWSNW